MATLDNMLAVLLLAFGIAASAEEQFGPLMKAFIPLGDRLPGFPEVYRGLLPDSPKYHVFPQDSAATYDDSANRCKGLGASLARIEGPDELEQLGCLLRTPSYIAGWSHSSAHGKAGASCAVLMPGGVIVGTILTVGADL